LLLELQLLHFPTNPGDASNQPPIETGVEVPVTPQYMSNSIATKKQHLDLEEALQYTREGDIVVVWRLDRLDHNAEFNIDCEYIEGTRSRLSQPARKPNDGQKQCNGTINISLLHNFFRI